MTDPAGGGEEEGEDSLTSHIGPYAYPCQKRLLSAIEEKTLCGRAQNGDESAQEKMILFNLRLVIRIAARYKGKSLVLEDLVQEGVIGLMTAVAKYDTTQNFRFSTYATYWIRQSIVRAIEKQDRQIRVPAYLYKIDRQVRHAEERLIAQGEEAPTEARLLEEAALRPKAYRLTAYLQPEPLSLDLLMGTDQDATLADLLEDSAEVNPEQVVMRQAAGEEMQALLGGLAPRDRMVMERRFGFHDGSVWTLAALARLLNVSRETIRQIEKRSLQRLRVAAAERENEDDLPRGALSG